MVLAGKECPIECKEAFGEGIVAFEQDDFEPAAEAFEACRETGFESEQLDSILTQCYLSLTKSSLSRNEESAAAAWLEKALLLNPDFPMLHIIAAHLYRGLKRNAIANRHLKQALELDPENAEAKALQLEESSEAEIIEAIQQAV